MATCPDCGKKFRQRRNNERCARCEKSRGEAQQKEAPAVQGTLVPDQVSHSGTLLSPAGASPAEVSPAEVQSKPSSDGGDDSVRPSGTLALPSESSTSDTKTPATKGRATIALPPDVIESRFPSPHAEDGSLSTSDFIRSLPSDFASPNATIRIDALRESVGDCTPAIRSIQEDRNASPQDVDYEILGKIGEGGMGVIYRALQKSINREVAIKKIKSDVAGQVDIKSKFIIEAAFTGELAHPNIVPIHDLGLDADGGLFYSMKVVDGEPWHSVLAQNSRAQNIEILVRVADAIAFAHSKGIIHRDLKPENIMIGEFGEVVVMDWGLAAKFTDGRQPAPGGSPAYMAPEMANAFLATMNKSFPEAATDVGDFSDVYLLGALLFEIVAGRPPHDGGDALDRRYEVFNCLCNAARNSFVDVTDPNDPLIEISKIAMAADPRDRYQNVGAFQEAIREYEAHAQSIGLTERAENDLAKADETGDYDVYARSVFGFQDALQMWPGNQRAADGEAKAKLLYAQAALGKNDFDLGLSLLDPAAPSEQSLHRKLQRAAEKRDRRENALRLFKFAVVALGVALLLGGMSYVKRERDVARRERKASTQIKSQAEKLQQNKVDLENNIVSLKETQKRLTNTISDRDRKNKELTDAQVSLQKKTAEAVQNAVLAQDRLFQSEYGGFSSRMALARSNIDDGAFENAISLLDVVRSGDTTRSMNIKSDWEWQRLRYLSHPEIKYHQTGGREPRIALSADGKLAITAAVNQAGATVRVWDVQSQASTHQWTLESAARVNDVSVTPDGKFVYVACLTKGPNQPSIVGWSTQTGRRVVELVTHLRKDKTGNTKQIVITRSEPWALVSSGAAGDPSEEGVLSHWQIDREGKLTAKRKLTGYFSEATSVALSGDGSVIASVHRRSETKSRRKGLYLRLKSRQQSGKPTDFDTREHGAGTRLYFHPTDPNVLLAVESDTLYRYQLGTSSQRKPTVLYRFWLPIESLAYARDGREVVLGTNEGTVIRFDIANRKVLSTLGGHVSKIVDCDYQGEVFASVEQAGGLRFWNLATYRDEDIRKTTEVVSASLGRNGRVATLNRLGVATRSEGKTLSTSCGYLLSPASEARTLWRHFDTESQRLFTMTTDPGQSRGVIRVWAADGRRTGYQISVASNTLIKVAPGGRKVLLAVPSSKRRTQAAVVSGVRVWNVDEKKIDRIDIEGSPTAIALPENLTDDARNLICAKGIGLVTQSGNRLREGSSGDRVVEILPSENSIAFLVESNNGFKLETGIADGRAAKATTIPAFKARSFAKGILAVLGSDGKVTVWDTRQTAPQPRILPIDSVVRTAAISPSGKALWFASNQTSSSIQILDLETNQVRVTPIRFGEGEIHVIAADQVLISTNESDRIYDVMGNEIQSYGGEMEQALVTESGDTLILGSDGVVRVWEAQTERISRSFSAGRMQKILRLLSVDEDEILVVVSDDSSRPINTVAKWNYRTGAELGGTCKCRGDFQVADAIRSRIAIVTTDPQTTLFVGDESGLKVATQLSAELGVATSIALAPDGSCVAVGMTEGVLLYQVDDGGHAIGDPIVEKGLTDVTAIRFSPSSKRIVTGHSNGNVAIWYFDFDTQNVTEDEKSAHRWDKLVNLRKLHNARVHTLEFSADSQSLLTADSNGTALRFATPTVSVTEN